MKPIFPRRCVSLVFGVVLTLVVDAACADDAEQLFREGRALMLEGRYDAACAKLAVSQRLDPHVGTLLNLAACHERQGKVASAWVEYQKTLTAARAEGQTERARIADESIQSVGPRVPWLRISSSSSDVVVALDGSPLAAAAINTDLPVDPGPHVVSAERRGTRVFETALDLREGERRDVRITLPATSQETLVVEPSAAPPLTAPPRPSRKGRIVFEPGVFVALIAGRVDDPTIHDPNAISFGPPEEDNDSNAPGGACATAQSCHVGSLSNVTSTAGANVFLGYSITEHLDLGVRGIVAPKFDKSEGLWAVGPSAALHLGSVVTVGAWALLGNTGLRGQSRVTRSDNEVPLTANSIVYADADGFIGGAIGAGAELSVRLFAFDSGALVATATPFAMFGSRGYALALPVGFGCRF